MSKGIVFSHAKGASRGATTERPQMADIARMAGVSVSSVSRALSGDMGVRASTRARIEDIARALRYEVHVSARNLRLRQNRTISVVVPHSPVARESLSDPFFLGLIGGIADALTEKGYDMLLSRVDASQPERIAKDFETGRAMGVILIGQGHHHACLNEMAARGIPLVVWGACVEGQAYVTVGSDNVQGGRLATEHLLECGARRIAFMGDTSLPEVALRHCGYVQAHHARGELPAMELARPVPFVKERMETEVERLLQSDPSIDAFFASSDVSAMTVINALRRMGKRVPEDILVAGYDDITMAAQFHPSLTTVGQSISMAGSALLQALDALLNGLQPASIKLPTLLYRRESTAARPG